MIIFSSFADYLGYLNTREVKLIQRLTKILGSECVDQYTHGLMSCISPPCGLIRRIIYNKVQFYVLNIESIVRTFLLMIYATKHTVFS